MSFGAFLFAVSRDSMRFAGESSASTAVVAVHAADIANVESSGDAFVSFSSATSDCSILTKQIAACTAAITLRFSGSSSSPSMLDSEATPRAADAKARARSPRRRAEISEPVFIA